MRTDPECPEVPSDFNDRMLGAVSELPLHLGRGVSYGHAYVTKGYDTIGLVPVGYSDGYRRDPGNQVLIHGRRVPVVGKVCMDQIMVQPDNIPGANTGDEVVLLGKQREERIIRGELYQKWGIINYKVTCDLSACVPRLYHG